MDRDLEVFLYYPYLQDGSNGGGLPDLRKGIQKPWKIEYVEKKSTPEQEM